MGRRLPEEGSGLDETENPSANWKYHVLGTHGAVWGGYTLLGDVISKRWSSAGWWWGGRK